MKLDSAVVEDFNDASTSSTPSAAGLFQGPPTNGVVAGRPGSGGDVGGGGTGAPHSSFRASGTDSPTFPRLLNNPAIGALLATIPLPIAAVPPAPAKVAVP